MVTTVCSQLAQYMPFTFRTTRWEFAAGAADADVAVDCVLLTGEDASALAAVVSDAADSPRSDVHARELAATNSVPATTECLPNAEKRTEGSRGVTSNSKTPAGCFAPASPRFDPIAV